jgi:hypothetical protein
VWIVRSGAIVWRTNKNPDTRSRGLGGQANGSGLATCSVCGETQRVHWSPEIVLGQDIGITLEAFLGWINN